MGKKAIITLELVEEGSEASNAAITRELSEWFNQEAVPAPWVKEVKTIVVQDA
jgi:hypothetical protein